MAFGITQTKSLWIVDYCLVQNSHQIWRNYCFVARIAVNCSVFPKSLSVLTRADRRPAFSLELIHVWAYIRISLSHAHLSELIHAHRNPERRADTFLSYHLCDSSRRASCSPLSKCLCTDFPAPLRTTDAHWRRASQMTWSGAEVAEPKQISCPSCRSPMQAVDSSYGTVDSDCHPWSRRTFRSDFGFEPFCSQAAPGTTQYGLLLSNSPFCELVPRPTV